MRFRDVEIRHKIRLPNDSRVYVKIDNKSCVYLDKNGKPQMRDFESGRIVECTGELKGRFSHIKNGEKPDIGPKDNPQVTLKLRIMGEHGGKDIYVECRQSEIDSVVSEHDAKAYWILGTEKQFRENAKAIAENEAEIRNKFLRELNAALGK